MPPFKPIKRKDLIKALKEAGFEGPFAGGRHEFLVKGELRLVLPNPHIKVKSAKTCWREFFARPTSRENSGKNCDLVMSMAGAKTQAEMDIYERQIKSVDGTIDGLVSSFGNDV